MKGKIRVVPEQEWDQYSITDIAKAAKLKHNKFHLILHTPDNVEAIQYGIGQRAEKQKLRNAALGIKPKPEAAQQQKKEVPVGMVIGNGIAHEADPLNVAREETIRLVVPDISKIKSVGNYLSQRFPMSYQTDEGEKKAFFTAKSEQSISFRMNKMFEKTIKENPAYKDELVKMQRYLNLTEREFDQDADMGDLITGFFRNPPYEEFGISPERANELKQDQNFKDLFFKTLNNVIRVTGMASYYQKNGVATGERIETRNVAMSDISEVLGVSDLIAKSTTAQIMSGGTIIDGVLMEKAEGVDIQNIGDGHPMAQIKADQASEVYNQPEALKKLADLQILDYICMNEDRHEKNMTFQFEGLGTDAPKFTGICGFDNDSSFGSNVPEPTATITVISESMAQKLKDPKLMDDIEEKMRKNGLPEAEIDSAKQRLDKLKTAVAENKIRTVKDEDWCKKDKNTTIEQLSAESKDSIFLTVNKHVIKPMAKKAENWFKLPENRRNPVPDKELTYGKAIKVESFGMNAQEQKQLDDLTKEEEKKFRADIEKTVSTAKINDAASMKECLREIKNNAKNMYQQLDNADPTFHGTSSEYKQLKAAAKELRDLSSKLAKKLKNDNAILSPEDGYKLVQAMDKVTDRSAVYASKKQIEIDDGIKLSKVGNKRLLAANNSADSVREMRQGFKKSLSHELAKQSPIAHVHKQLKTLQEMMPEKSGEKLREFVAREIYYRGLEGSSLTAKKNTNLLKALNPEVMDRSVQHIQKTPAFKKLAQMPDQELRSLAMSGDGGKLMDKFFHEAAKVKQADIIRQKNQKKDLNVNPERKDPEKGM